MNKTLTESLNSSRAPSSTLSASAGVAAGFNAPISGVFFAVESVLQSEPRNSETEARNSSGLTVAMVLLACVTAAVVSQAGLGESPTFRVPLYQLQSTWEFPLVIGLGSLCGLVSLGFSYCSEVHSSQPGIPQSNWPLCALCSLSIYLLVAIALYLSGRCEGTLQKLPDGIPHLKCKKPRLPSIHAFHRN